ncbi:MAG: AAA family ATPase [Desulfovibrio sp.]|nr:AAA family ATPase [Desulfovibrio sp.]
MDFNNAPTIQEISDSVNKTDADDASIDAIAEQKEEAFLAQVDEQKKASKDNSSETPHTEEAVQNPDKKSRFEFHTLEGIEDTPPPEWLVSNVIIDGGMGQLWAPPASSKSFAAIDLGMHIANGWDWYGHRTEKRPVRYLILEGGEGFLMRLRAYKQYCTDNGRELNGDFQFYIGNLSLMDKQQVDELKQVIPEGSLVIVDTQARSMVGVKENTDELGVAIANAQEISFYTKCTTLFLHHSGKNIEMGARGWSGQGGAWDFEFSINREKKNRNFFIITFKKVKDGKDGETHKYELLVLEIKNSDNSPLLNKYNEKVTSCVIECRDEESFVEEGGVIDFNKAEKCDYNYHQNDKNKLTKAQRLAIETLEKCLEETGEDCVDEDIWRPYFYDRYPNKSVDAKRKAFDRARKDLVGEGHIFLLKDYYSLKPFETSKAPDEADKTDKTDKMDKITSCPPDKTDMDTPPL